MAVEQKLVAVIVPRDPSLTVLGLKRHCAAILPPYMVPHEFVLLAGLPKTSTGKVDRVRVQKGYVEGTLESQVPSAVQSGERATDADAR
jgi:acyl-CoA synthetase (AMP-forming)/AMP-acid ligase II